MTGIDFSALVLGAAMDAFGQPITVTPLKSMPGTAPYPARGSYANKPITIQLEGSDDVHQTNERTLGIRLSEFPKPPKQGDQVVMTVGIPITPGALPATTFVVFNVLIDGQGGADLVLRETTPVPGS